MENNTGKKNLEFDQETLKNLNAIRKWSMFLALLGFIVVGFLLIAGLVAGTFFSFFRSDEVGLGVLESLTFILSVIIGAVYFMPVLFLFRFSRQTAKALRSSGQEDFRKAFRNLRAFFTYIGILAIIVILIYIAALLITGTSVAFPKP